MKTKQSPMLVNTADAATGIITPIKYAKTKDGKIDLAAYKGKSGRIKENNLTIDVTIVDARRRYGHLDLNVTPISGSGNVWVERKNIEIDDDPAFNQVTSTMKVEIEAASGGAGHTVSLGDLRDLVAKMVAEEKARV